MITIAPAVSDDIINFEYDGIEKPMLDHLDWRKMLFVYYQHGYSWRIDSAAGKMVMLYGMYEISPGVAQAWMLMNKDARPHAKSIARAIRRHLEQQLTKYHRIQTLVMQTDKAIRYVKLFGFEKEATLKCYGPNRESVDIYSAVSSCHS